MLLKYIFKIDIKASGILHLERKKNIAHFNAFGVKIAI